MSSAMATPPSASEAPPARAGGRAWLSLAVLVLPVVLISVDMTVLGFAVPHLSADLSPTGTQLLWIVDIYSFMLAGLLVTMGTLGDRIGRRRLLLLGSFGFGLASLMAAYATTPEMLIAARALLGMAGATLMPATLSLLRNIFTDRRQRVIAIAAWSSGFSAGAALGPILGGWLLEHFWWGSVFLINLPVMAATLVLGRLLLPESRDPNPGRYDLPSVALSMATLLPVVYGVKKLAEGGPVLLALAAIFLGLTVGLLFVRRQLRLDNPMIDVRLFALRRFSTAVVTNLILTFALVAALFALTQYLQLVLGLNPMRAGLVLLPGMVLTVAASFVAAPLARRVPMGTLLASGLGMATLGFAVMTQLSPDGGAPLVMAGFAVLGIGVGFTDTVTNDAILSEAPPHRAGAASAISETAYELGAALGIAVLGSVLTAVYRIQLDTVPDVPDTAMAEARETLGGASLAAENLPDELAHQLLSASHAAFTSGLHVTSLLGVVIVAGAAVQAGVLLRRRRDRANRASGRGTADRAVPHTPLT
ncbi:MFS transporter [Lipingzhangella sp. LS1_29]|uniref:MFS transporter n=1 Tax=Lipingzhangella rawalii TaxID=2055835 RepID=A0ABU2H447_9ACTN|nr:MFS transporter [Lipingzhangella rawalii]MDS1269600.1 MFS transporter [Lipingzhangella rawalii]